VTEKNSNPKVESRKEKKRKIPIIIILQKKNIPKKIKKILIPRKTIPKKMNNKTSIPEKKAEGELNGLKAEAPANVKITPSVGAEALLEKITPSVGAEALLEQGTRPKAFTHQKVRSTKLMSSWGAVGAW
jgi:hypothetical protein